MSSSPFNSKELKVFHALLLEKKSRVLEEIKEQQQSLAEGEAIGDLVDMATSLLEKELNFSLSEKEREMLEEIDKAIERIENKTYGVCVDTNEPISKDRLKAVPEAIRTIKAQEAYELKMKKQKRPYHSA